MYHENKRMRSQIESLKKKANNKNRLAEVRKEQGISSQQLADISGVSYPAIRSYENGSRVGKRESWEAIAAALGVSVAYLMNLENSKCENEISISKQEYYRLKEIERKYNEIKSLVAD